MKTNRGMTLIEILVVVALIGIISSIVLLSLSKFRNERALNNTTQDIVSLLNKARQNTLSSVNSVNYGVHIESDKAVLFSGSSYAPSSYNETVDIISGIEIYDGLGDIVFERLTGDTNGGTIKLRIVSDLTKERIITISKTGIVSSN